jgi:hypothetical protein
LKTIFVVLAVAIAAVFITNTVLVTTEAEAKKKLELAPLKGVRAPIAASGDSVYVTWWERNETSDTPVARVSNDNGATFGPMLMLATIGGSGGQGG